MKTTKYIVAAISLIVGLSSCYDLDVAPYDKVGRGSATLSSAVSLGIR